MPVIFVEEKKEVQPGVFKTETKVCNLNDWIIVDGVVMHYIPEFKSYQSQDGKISLSPTDYLKLKEEKNNAKKESGREL